MLSGVAHVQDSPERRLRTIDKRIQRATPCIVAIIGQIQRTWWGDRPIGPMVRSLFLPEEGELWGSNDFSSQEPRLLVHYANLLELPGADVMVDAYRNDPDTDFHQMVADMAGIKRKAAKTIGLGLMYGMGKAKLAQQLDLPVDEASDLIGTFHSKVPFLKATVDAVMKRIEHPSSGGSIRTLGGMLALSLFGLGPLLALTRPRRAMDLRSRQ